MKKFEYYLFYISLIFFIFFASILYSEHNQYLILSSLLLLLLNYFVYYRIKKFKNFLYNISILIVFTSLLGIIFGQQNTFRLKDYIDNSRTKAKFFLSHNLKKIFKYQKQKPKKNNINNLEKFTYLESDDLFVLTKRQGNEISILNHKFEKNDELSYYSNKVPVAVPFFIFKNSDLLISSAWWDSSDSLMRVNSKFEIIWKNNSIVHHFASIDGDKIYVPSFINYYWEEFIKTEYYKRLSNYNCRDNSIKFINRPHYNNYINDLNQKIIMPKDYKDKNHPVRIDTIKIIDKNNGKTLDEINLLDIIMNNSHFYNLLISSRSARCSDLLHVNDVRIIKKSKKIKELFFDNKSEEYYSSLSKNLLLISVRDIDAIILIDSVNPKNIIWYVNGLFENQHSPRLLENGNLLLFDNYAFDERGSKFGHSAIKEINVKKKEIVSIFNGNENFEFSSQRRGRIQVVGKEIYVISSDQNVFFKLDCQPIKKKIYE